MMKCPYCGKEMMNGFLISSRDITFTDDYNINRSFRIKKCNDLELSKGSGLSLSHCTAFHCSSCKKIVIDYEN